MLVGIKSLLFIDSRLRGNDKRKQTGTGMTREERMTRENNNNNSPLACLAEGGREVKEVLVGFTESERVLATPLSFPCKRESIQGREVLFNIKLPTPTTSSRKEFIQLFSLFVFYLVSRIQIHYLYLSLDYVPRHDLHGLL